MALYALVNFVHIPHKYIYIYTYIFVQLKRKYAASFDWGFQLGTGANFK